MVGTDIIIITVNIESSQLSESLQFLPRVYVNTRHKLTSLRIKWVAITV